MLARKAFHAFLAALLLGPVIGQGAEQHRHPVQVVTADDSATTRRIVEELRKRIPSASVGSDPEKRRSDGKSPVYIAIGPTALRSLVAKSPDGLVISAFSSSQSYRQALATAPAESRATSITAVYADPAPATQMRLIAMLYKKPVSAAVILSDKTAQTAPLLQRAATQAGVPLTIETLESNSSLNRVLNRISEVPVILTVPDTTVLNAENLRNILVTTYRNHQAVIGFSSALVKAGALATTSSDIEDVVAQLAEVVDEYESTGKVPEPQFPKYFSTQVNSDVARSLNIIVDEAVRSFSRKPTVVR